MDYLQLISIVLEAVVVVVAFLIGARSKKIYGFGLCLAFAIYVYYDIMKLFMLVVPPYTLSALFFMASVSALVSVWALYKKP